MRAGLTECLEKGLRNIEVEVDAKGLVEMLKTGEVLDTSVEGILTQNQLLKVEKLKMFKLLMQMGNRFR